MNSEMNSSLYIRRTLRYLEWIFLALMASIELRWFDAFGSPKRALTILIVYSTFAGLSCIFPIARPLWQRQGYVFLGVLLATLALSMGLTMDPMFYLYVAKSWFLLDRRTVIATVIISGITATLGYAWSQPQLMQLAHSRGINVNDPGRRTADFLMTYFAATSFVSAFSLVAIAEQKSRQRAQALALEVEILAATLERTRIARDIHDSLGHTLTTLNVQLEVAQKLRQHDPKQALQALDTAKLLTSQCIEDVSYTLQTMRQSFDLNQALTALVEQIRQSQPLSIYLKLDLPQLPLQTNHQLYCIIKEGLTNIQKHAGASRVSIHAELTSQGITLELADNGIGFDLQAPRFGFGLRGIEERVQIIGGQFNLKSAIGQGTQILVTLPL